MTRRRRKARSERPLGEDAAREKCLRLLELRARSAAELRRRLREVGFEEDVIEPVLSALAEAKLIDDEDFARSWVSSRQAAGRGGRQKLRWELRGKGVSDEIIRLVVDEGVDDETELRQALALAESRLRGRPVDATGRTKLQRLLLGRGFEYATVEAVLRRISDEGEH